MTARIENKDWGGAFLRNINMARAKGVEIYLEDASLSGYIAGLKINGIEVAPLIEQEMQRRYPERSLLEPTDREGFHRALGMLEDQFRVTWERARALDERRRQEQVDEEWSVVETIRHLVFVIDGWVSRIINGEDDPFHPIGLPPSFLPRKPEGTSVDPEAAPTFDEALSVWEGRLAKLRLVIDGLNEGELERPIEHIHANDVRTALWIVLDELWAHNRYMNRDISVLERGDA